MNEDKRIKVSVTAEDIANGKHGNCSLCPVALAVNRAIGQKFDAVRIGFRNAEFGYGDPDERVLPWRAQEFVLDYESGRPVEPFEFEMDVPAWVIQEARK